MITANNPFLVLWIQKELGNLKGGDLLSITLKNNAYKDIKGAIKLAHECYTDNQKMAQEILGEQLLKDILEYVGRK